MAGWSVRARGRASWGREEGAGTLLAVALLFVGTVAALAVLSLSAALATHQRVSVAADSAAVVAADALRGLVGGAPCDLAAQVVAAHRATLSECHIEGVVARVTVRSHWGAIVIEASAEAGPPRP